MNVYARTAGLMVLDAARIHAANAVHEGLTVATLLPDSPVDVGQMLATVKIIPYAGHRASLWNDVPEILHEPEKLFLAHRVGIFFFNPGNFTSNAVVHVIRGQFKQIPSQQ